jgi:hypothetical protein
MSHTQAGAGDALCALLLGEPLPDDDTQGQDDGQPPQQPSRAASEQLPASAFALTAALPPPPAKAGDAELARAVCEEALAAQPQGALWARARLARLQLDARECAAAAASYQAAIRAAPADAALWEGLGAAYQVGWGVAGRRARPPRPHWVRPAAARGWPPVRGARCWG